MSDNRGRIALLTTRELNRETKAVLERVAEGEQFIVVRRGMPIAAVGPVSREALEAFVFANSPEIRKSLERAEEEAALGKARLLAREESVAESDDDTFEVQAIASVEEEAIAGEVKRGYSHPG